MAPQCYKSKAVPPLDQDVASNTDLEPSDILSLDSDIDEEEVSNAEISNNLDGWTEALSSQASEANENEDLQSDWVDASIDGSDVKDSESSNSAGMSSSTIKYPLPSFVPPPTGPEDRTVDYILLYEKLVAEYGHAAQQSNTQTANMTPSAGTVPSMPNTQGHPQSQKESPSEKVKYQSSWVSDAIESESEASECYSPVSTHTTTKDTPQSSAQGSSEPADPDPALAEPHVAPLYWYIVDIPIYQPVAILVQPLPVYLPALAMPTYAPVQYYEQSALGFDPYPSLAADAEYYRRQLDALAAHPLETTAPGADVNGLLVKGHELPRLAEAMTPLESEALYVVHPYMGDHLHYI